MLSMIVDAFGLRHILIVFGSIIYGIIDYNYDFFTVKTLNLFSSYEFKMLKYLKEMKLNINNINYEYIIILYGAFILCFINFLYYLSLSIIVFDKRKNLRNIEYKMRTTTLEKLLKYQQSIFLVFYYIGLLMDDFNFFSCLLPFIIFINTFSYNLYILKSNEIIEDIQNNTAEEVIYSFENNPMLGIEVEDI